MSKRTSMHFFFFFFFAKLLDSLAYTVTNLHRCMFVNVLIEKILPQFNGKHLSLIFFFYVFFSSTYNGDVLI